MKLSLGKNVMQQRFSKFPEFHASTCIVMYLSLLVPSVFLSPIVLRGEAAFLPFARERCLLYHPSVGTHPPAWQQERGNPCLQWGRESFLVCKYQVRACQF